MLAVSNFKLKIARILTVKLGLGSTCLTKNRGWRKKLIFLPIFAFAKITDPRFCNQCEALNKIGTTFRLKLLFLSCIRDSLPLITSTTNYELCESTNVKKISYSYIRRRLVICRKVANNSESQIERR